MQTVKNDSGPLNGKRAFEEVSTRIKKWIIQGVFKPGDKLPSETDLARQFKVGRQTVREALRLLELSGFLTVRKGARGGSVITNTILETLSQSFLDAVQMKNIDIAEVITARAAIDKMVLSLAIEQATEEDIALLNENIRIAEQKLAKGIPAFEENITFHTALAKATHNGIFVIVVESIMTIMTDFLSRSPQALSSSRKNVEDHKNILKTLRERDATRALALTDNHLKLVGKIFTSSSKNKLGRKRPGKKKDLNNH
jgi:DNA-binding FadR family transcriptional regulator